MDGRTALLILICLLASFPSASKALEDPSGGKPFLEWAWEDQYVPTFKAAGETKSLVLLAGSVAATAASFQYDDEIRATHVNHQRISGDLAKIGSQLGSGPPGVGIAIIQLFFDQKNGLAHFRALTLTSAVHFSSAHLFKRERPNNGSRLSFPSGHNSSAFASATSLAYSYGWKVGVPAYAGAMFVTMARIADDTHWFSDVVAGSALGFFWGRASALSDKYREGETVSTFNWTPMPIDGGAVLVANWEF